MSGEKLQAALAGMLWNDVHRELRAEGVSEEHAMARADVVRIEFDRHWAALAAPSTPEPSGLLDEARRAVDASALTDVDMREAFVLGYVAALRAAPSTEPALDERLRAFVEHRVGLAALQHPDDWRERDLYLASAADAVSEAIRARPAEAQP